MKIGNLLIAVIIAVPFLLGISPQSTSAQNVVIVGSKDFDENIVLAWIIQILLEDAEFVVVSNIDTGSTSEVRQALVEGRIDIYPEYTATGVTLLAQEFPDLISQGDAYNSTDAIAIVSSFDAVYNGLVWLVPAPGNSSYALAVLPDFAEANNIETIEDLANYANAGGEVQLAGTPDFFSRSDAFVTYSQGYQFEVPSENRFIVESEDPTLTLNALRNGEAGVNVAMAYSTSGELLSNEFVMLEDNQNAQPYFQPAPVVRQQIIEQNPEIIAILRPAFALIDTITMQRFVAATNAGLEPEQVARDFLLQNGFISDVERLACNLTRSGGDTSANLRGGPGLTFPVRGALSVGDTVGADGQSEGSDGAIWYRLDTGGAWVRSDVVETTGGCNELPVVSR